MRKYLYKAITLILIMNMMILSVSCGKVGEMRSEIKSDDGIAEYAHKKAVGISEKAEKFYEDNKYLFEKSETNDTRTLARHNTVLEALDEKDAEKLKSVFCELLLSQPDLDEQIENMFTYFDGGIAEYYSTTTARTYYEKSGGIEQTSCNMSRTTGIVTGNGEKYIKLIVFSNDVYVERPDLVGVSGIVLVIEEATSKNDGKSVEIEVHE